MTARKTWRDQVIEVSGLTKRFGARTAVDRLDLSVAGGEVYGFLGANGAGKTTTIRMLLGILDPDGGSVRICGRTVRRGDREGRRLVGAVGETQHLYGGMSCRDYLAFFASLYGLVHPVDRAEEVLHRVGLSDRAEDLTTDLSKGLQQKLGLARALIHDPPVLVLDEPVSGLDPHGIRDVRDILSRERDRGRLIFFSSHALAEVSQIADRIGIMLRGRLVKEDPVKTVLAQHDSLEDAFVEATSEPAPESEFAAA